MEIVETFAEVDKRIFEAELKSADFLYYLTPTNLGEMRGNPDPEFRYKSLDFDPDKIIEEVDKIRVPEGELYEVYQKKKDEINLKIKMLKHRGERNKVLELSEKLYGKPKSQTVTYARRLLEESVYDYPELTKNFTSENLKERIEEVLKSWNIEDWKIELSEKPEVTVSPSKKRITIGKERKFSERDIERLIEHEIKVHTFRAENGYVQPLKIFLTGFPGYLKTEEGLAIYREKIKNLLENKKLREYAARVIAVDMMYNGYEFEQIYEELKGYGFSDEKAWDIAYRALRAGGFGKDYIYLEGLRDVEIFLENSDRNEKLRLLYVGKVGINDIELVENLLSVGEITEPKYFPRW